VSKGKLFSFAFLLLLLPSWAAAQTTIYSRNGSGTIPKQLFNVHGWGFANNYTPWPAAAVGGYRTWDSGAVWSSIEPSRGSYNWGQLDQIVNFVQGKGANVLFTFGRTPRWASSNPNSYVCGGGPGQCYAPYSMTDWSNFVWALTSRYKYRIRYYELWNEPNASNWWSGSTSQMVQMASIAYHVIKQQDPGAVVLSPAPQGAYAWQWMGYFLAAGGGKYFDAAAFHGYVGAVNGYTRAPEAWIPIVQNLRNTLTKYGLGGRAIYDTELSWGASWQTPSTYTQAGWMARMYLLHWLFGSNRLFWYMWDSNTYGTMYSSGSLRPAAIAYQQLNKWLVGASMDRCLQYTNGTWACHLSRGSYNAWVLWNANGSAGYQLSSTSGMHQARNLSGGKWSIASNAWLSLGVQPMLVESWSVF
jgi:hypothetical protein